MPLISYGNVNGGAVTAVADVATLVTLLLMFLALSESVRNSKV